MIQFYDNGRVNRYISFQRSFTTDRLPNTNRLNRTFINTPRTFIIECPHLSKVGRQHFERAFT